ncbi:MAG: S8 family serine peptidase [Actinomycetota bacterium]|nr:S8 family serine peptidase [Actinomycetota bacterium]
MNPSFRRVATGAVAVFLVTGSWAAPSGSVAQPTTAPAVYHKLRLRERMDRSWAPRELLVRFRAGAGRTNHRRVHAAAGARLVDSIPAFSTDLVRIAGDVSLRQAASRYLRSPLVDDVEPNLLFTPTQVLPNDPRFDDQWNLHNTGQRHPITDPPPDTSSGRSDADIDGPEAWETQKGSPSTVIAVVDTGVDVGHDDLNSSIWSNPEETPGNNIDDDANGLVDDVNGWDFAENDDGLVENNSDIEGFDHGTHVAGIIGAEMDNSSGVSGICPGCKIMVLKFMRPRDTDGDGDQDTMLGTLAAELKALAYARREGADIVNGSYSAYSWSKLERHAFVATGNAGILSVLAAGNSSLDNDMTLSISLPGGVIGFSPEYPASYDLPQIISVAASNHRDHYGYFTGCDQIVARWKCSFTNWGRDSVDLAAPGVDIVSTVPGGYDEFNGTSMAAPHVAAVAGMLKSERPALGALALKNAIMNSADRPDSLRDLYAFRRGPIQGRFSRTNGRLNADDALDAPTIGNWSGGDGNVAGAKRIRRFKSDRIGWPSDVNDVYKKHLRRGRRYRAVLDGPGDEDFDLLAWKPKTKEIWQLEDGCFLGFGSCKLLRYAKKRDADRADESFEFRAKKSGTYYFHVSAWLHSQGHYDLKVRRL